MADAEDVEADLEAVGEQKQVQRAAPTMEERSALLVVKNVGTTMEELDKRMKYHFDVKRRIAVAAGSRDLLEAPFKRAYWLGVVTTYIVLVLIGVWNGIVAVYHTVQWDLPPLWLCIVLLVFDAFLSIICALLCWRAMTATARASAQIMNLSYQQKWTKERYRGHSTGKRLPPGWVHEEGHSELELSRKPVIWAAVLWVLIVVPCAAGAITVIVLESI